MKFHRLFESLALEDETNVTTQQQETEITLYAKINNFEGLKHAKSSEEQIQVEARLGEANHCRVRKTIVGETTSYQFMFKVKNGSHSTQVDSRREYPVDVNEEFFNGFLSIADKVQDKVRYFFDSETITLSYKEQEENREITIPDIVYEVDVFKKPDGTFSNYCKIDIEVDKILLFLEHNYPEIKDINLNFKISTLPFAPTDGIVNEKDNETVQAFIRHLYDTEFCTDLVKQREGQ